MATLLLNRTLGGLYEVYPLPRAVGIKQSAHNRLGIAIVGRNVCALLFWEGMPVAIIHPNDDPIPFTETGTLFDAMREHVHVGKLVDWLNREFLA